MRLACGGCQPTQTLAALCVLAAIPITAPQKRERQRRRLQQSRKDREHRDKPDPEQRCHSHMTESKARDQLL